MRKKKIILLCTISLALLAGCGRTAGAVNTETTAATTTETTATATVTAGTDAVTETENTIPEDVDYQQNEDGTWNYRGQDYKHRLMLTGTLPNAAADSYYVVLSDSEDITFKDASDFFLSSTLHPEEEKRFAVPNLGVYTPDCEVPSAKVLVSAVAATPSGVTVCFDQYDNTVKAELLTGEYYVLEKKDGDDWVEVEPIISDAAFSAVGIMVQKGGITRKTYDWEWLYGRQEPGQYRIRVQVVDDSVHEAAAVFMITD